jgi:hypothetical protein
MLAKTISLAIINNMSEKSPWADAFGPVYLIGGLKRRGIEDTDGLIYVNTSDNSKVYPQDQFDIQPDFSLPASERLLPITAVLKFYADVILPAIQNGIIDEYTITAWLFNIHPPLVSKAAAIANNPANVEDFKFRAENWFHRLSQ